MTTVSFALVTEEIRAAARNDDPVTSVREVLTRLVENPGLLQAITPKDCADEDLLFEDEGVSIWRCRFQPHVVMPPHEHKLPVLIAGYGGGEESIFYERSDNGLIETARVVARSGDVILLAEDAIHAVTAEGDQPSDAIHVYFGPLMTLKRDLFDWNTGNVVEFSMDNFEAMKKHSPN